MTIIRKCWKLAGLSTAFLTFATFTSESAQAITFSNPSNFSNLGSSGSVVEGVNESNTEIFYFNEGVTTLDSTGVEVDAIAPTSFSEIYGDDSIVSGTAVDPTSGTLSDQDVSSFYFSFDAVDDPSNEVSLGGTGYEVTFSQPILGLIFTETGGIFDNDPGRLGDSQTELADTNNFTYPSGNRGLEINSALNSGSQSFNNEDTITWVNANTLRFDNLGLANANVDQIRVVTEPVPFEAETGIGLVLLGSYLGWRRFCRRKQAVASDN